MVIGVIQYSKWAWTPGSKQGSSPDTGQLKNAVNRLSHATFPEPNAHAQLLSSAS